MSRTILVPLDGSPFAEHALPAAIAIARRTGAALELITVDRAPVSWVVPEVPIVMDEVLPVQDGQRYLEELHERMPADIPVRLTTLNGRATPFLVRHITTTEPAMVVMSTHGRGGFSRLWLGSVADGVARQSPAPILMVKPPPTEVDLSAVRRFPRVLIPLDGSVAGEEILDQTLVTFGVENVEYTLMRVISPLAVDHQWEADTPPVRRTETHPESLLRAAADRMRARCEGGGAPRGGRHAGDGDRRCRRGDRGAGHCDDDARAPRHVAVPDGQHRRQGAADGALPRDAVSPDARSRGRPAQSRIGPRIGRTTLIAWRSDLQRRG
jgi:nucleotide-binding universal stress UspA family protein